jgi:predicted Zn finger-like uncharacterized protein
MMITCPDCSTAYRVSAAALGPDGRSVKCARCGTRWHASAEPDTTSIETEVPDEAEIEAEAEVEALATQAVGAMATAGDDDLDGFAGDEAMDEDGGEDADAGASGDAEDTDTQDADETFGQDLMPFDAAADEREAETKKTPVDIESLARKPKIQVKTKPPEPVLRRIVDQVGQRARRVRPQRVVGAMMFFGAIALCAFAVTFRTPIVARMPDLAGLFTLAGLDVNLRGLEFRDLRTFREIEDGTIVLVIEGTIENISRQPMHVPAVRLALRSEDAQEIYAWIMEPRLRRLDVGGTTRFRTRLSAPPDPAADIQVRFVERGEQQARVNE